MPYLGNTPSTSFATVVKDTFNGGSTGYTLSKVATTNSVSVFVENVRQEPTTAYSVSGTTLTFTATTPSGTGNIYVLHMNPTTTTTHPASQALTATTGTFTGDVSLPDNVKVKLGTGDDSEILFDGTDTVIKHSAGSGKLELQTRRLDVKNADNNEQMIKATADASVVLYHNDVEKLKTQSDGVEITGDIVFTASGNGINLGVTSNTDSNTLDDYEEGTWTPTFLSGSWTYPFQHGVYTKIGDTVVVSATVGWSGTPNAGNTLGVNLPFTIKNVTNYRALAILGYIDGLDTSDKMLTLSGSANSSFAYFYRLKDNAAPDALNDGSGTSSSGEIQFTFIYKV